MTDPATLLALAERCEQAAGPDRELDARIECAVQGITFRKLLGPYAYRTSRGDIGLINAKRYTAWIDAAVTLVPEGYYWQAANGKRRHSEPQACADLFVAHGPNRGDMSFTADAATAALALCAAALRARAAMLHPAG